MIQAEAADTSTTQLALDNVPVTTTNSFPRLTNQISQATSGPSGSIRAALVERLRRRLREMEDETIERIRTITHSPDHASGDSQYDQGQKAAVRAALDYALAGVDRHHEALTLPIPPEIITQVHRAARQDVGLDIILRRYTAGYVILGDFVTQEIYNAHVLDHGVTMRMLQSSLASLLDRLTNVLTQEYLDEVERANRHPDQRRLECIRQLISGVKNDPAILNYNLNGWHIGLIGTGENAALLFNGLARELGCTLLCVSPGEREVWAWLGREHEFTTDEVQELVPNHKLAANVRLAIGESANGLSGWRLSHRQADDALLVLNYQDQDMVRYADIALLVPWLRDDVRARWLLDAYLSPLDGRRCPSAILQETLFAYFNAGRNSTLAARKINISRRTMRNRMALIEQSLGSLIDERQGELELALRIGRLYDKVA